MSKLLRSRSLAHRVAPSRGVTLVELLVGMTIGLLSVVIITQVMAVAESQKRTTMAGSDAQVNGSLALTALQREIRMAGYGLTGASFAAGCQIKGRYDGKDLDTAPWLLTPVRITQGTAGAPDSIRVMRSNSRAFSLPLITYETHAKNGTEFVMRNVITASVKSGDVMLAIPGDIRDNPEPTLNWCSLFVATDALSGVAVDVAAKRVYHGTSSKWNQAPDQSIFPTGGYPGNSVLVNAGTFVNDLYAVQNSELQRTAFNSATGAFADPVRMFDQVANLQAVYGLSDGTWTATEPAATTPATTAALWWQSVNAVRLVVVARSGLREKDEVTAAEPTWMPDGKTPETLTLAASKTDKEWMHYRYRTYETVIPLRNVLWQSKLED